MNLCRLLLIALLLNAAASQAADDLEQAFAKLDPQNYDRYKQPVTFLLVMACQSDSLRILQRSVRQGELEMPEKDQKFLNESIETYRFYTTEQVAMVKGVMTKEEDQQFSKLVHDSAMARDEAMKNNQFPEAIDFQRDCVRSAEEIGKKFDGLVTSRLSKKTP
ncbi:MAG: hypothetical protein J0L97_04955 [Alphaproteobacteria bacterium]|nr:hypothetical protein [Alphaproteobacteria bacterium]